MMPPADPPAPEPPVADESPPVAADASSGATAAVPRVPAPREAATPAPPAPVALTERDLQILAFERKWWKHAGSKEQAIRDTFDLSATRYYQLLNALLDNPAALEHDALLVGRLRRLRSTRARVRRR